MGKRLLNVIGLVFLQLTVMSQNSVRGFVRDSLNHEVLIGATIIDSDNKGVITNEFGYFSFSGMPAGNKLYVSYLGYKTKIEPYNTGDTIINIFLVPGITLETVNISSRISIETIPEMGAVSITMKELSKLPTLAEPDILKKLQLMPGVQGGQEGRSGMFVRGGSPDQNLFLIDGMPMYHVHHIGGLLSVFHSSVINDVKLYKGGFPARYGGRVSSVVDVRLKEGNKKEHHGEFGVGLASGDITLEGPLGSSKTSYIVSLRRFWYDILTRPLSKIIFNGFSVGYNFYDFYGKISHQISETERLYLTFYSGDDKLVYTYNTFNKDEFKFKNYQKWGNILGNLRYNKIFNERMSLDLKAGYTRYRFHQLDQTKKPDEIIKTEYLSYASDYSIKADFQWNFNKLYSARWGTDLIRHHYKPGVNTNTVDNSVERFGSKEVFATETAIYFENIISPIEWFNANFGLRYNTYYVSNKLFTNLEPRITLNLMTKNAGAFKLSYMKIMQPVHMLGFSGMGIASDLWVPSLKEVPPIKSEQYSVGYVKTLPYGFELNVEAYCKNLSNMIAYKEGAYFYGGSEDWSDKIEKDGIGSMKGVELLFRRTSGATNGWISYTLAKSDRQFTNINQGKMYPFKYDRRHDFTAVLQHSFSERLSVSATWMYGSPYPVTLATGKYVSNRIVSDITDYSEIFQPNIAALYSDKNSLRLESYHRLDFGVNYEWINKKGKKRKIIGGIYNAYSRMNAAFYYWDYRDPNDNTSDVVVKKAAILPIIPTLKYVASW